MLNPWFITGFCDGVASFTYSKTGGTFVLYFSIRQQESNQQIIEEIQRYFNGIGRIYTSKETASGKNGYFAKPTTYYRVTKIDELKIILDHFERYPLQSKKKLETYNLWRQMVLHKLDNYRSADHNKLQGLADKLSHLSSQHIEVKI